MEVVTVSPKFQVVIPLSIRKALGLKPGQQVEVRQEDGIVTLVPIRPIAELRGLVSDLPNDFEREPDRVL